MAKIKEVKEKGEGSGKFFTLKDIVGMPFEIMEDVNAESDFRDYVREAKELGGKTHAWLSLEIRIGNEQKDCHFTNSAMRTLRDAMPKGILSWKGQHAVVNELSKGFKPTKITRLLGDYAAPQGQVQLGQAPAATEFPQAPETMQQKTSRFIAGLGIGLHDSRIRDTMTSVFGYPEQAEFVFGMLKQSGQIVQKPDGCWVKSV